MRRLFKVVISRVPCTISHYVNDTDFEDPDNLTYRELKRHLDMRFGVDIYAFIIQQKEMKLDQLVVWKPGGNCVTALNKK